MPLRTEAEARSQIFCPRSVAAGGATVAHCLGVDCMAWRWAGWRTANGTIDAKARRKGGGDDDTRLGYCGLAGRPGDEA